MRLRVVLFVLAATAAATACVQNEPPAQLATAPSTAPPAAATSDSLSVPADRWRAVLIAGDSTSPAFNNGVETMRDRLASEGVRDISVLAADPSGLARAGLASLGNVRRTLQAPGQVPGKGACLAFMTSHGLPSGFALRAGMTFLEPSMVEQALDAGCGELPTVLIVSACYSGTFITNRMRKPNRIILTAAAPDRTSFGCGADSEYTDYDRCLLQQFDHAATWRELAVATKSCVEVAERRRGVSKASLPQSFLGSAVSNLRLPGR